jgi:hypothetical protein
MAQRAELRSLGGLGTNPASPTDDGQHQTLTEKHTSTNVSRRGITSV